MNVFSSVEIELAKFTNRLLVAHLSSCRYTSCRFAQKLLQDRRTDIVIDARQLFIRTSLADGHMRAITPSMLHFLVRRRSGQPGCATPTWDEYEKP